MKNLKVKYQALNELHSVSYKKLNKQFNFVGSIKLIVFISIIVLLYFYLKNYNAPFLIASIILAIGFIVLIKIQNKLAFKRKLSQTLAEINTNELDYLSKVAMPFEDGKEYVDTTHAFSYDLDFFGTNSLFHNINRTALFVGKTQLAKRLQSLLSNDEIILQQEAIKELTDKIEFRQAMFAFGKITNDSKTIYDKLIGWVLIDTKKYSKVLYYFSIVSPILLLAVLLLYIVQDELFYRSAAIALFLLNLGVMFSNIKGISKEVVSGTKINQIIRNYGLIIQLIETENFESKKLKSLQTELKDNEVFASDELKKLSGLFSQLDSIQNLFGATLFNGFALYHLHVIRNLTTWKSNHATKVTNWLSVLGEFETLNSLANFAYNNISFTYPQLNEAKKIVFKDLGHPLISDNVRVNNDVSFDQQKFMILTGSNMSGKSTFLRSMGINMVLAGIGAPVCASNANIHPSKVSVSMRLSDSLEDNESYFFAEVKRLKEIMVNSEKETSFILLDEILKGTNSDDKRVGTVEVIKKLITKNAIGALATHDLEVCLTTDEYPDLLINKCFEVEIVNNDLYFDYKLRDGICKNKSATFIMKKMDII